MMKPNKLYHSVQSAVTIFFQIGLGSKFFDICIVFHRMSSNLCVVVHSLQYNVGLPHMIIFMNINLGLFLTKLILQTIIFHKIVKTKALQFPRAQSDIFRCLLFSVQKSKTKWFSVYYHRRSENIYISKVGTSDFLYSLKDLND